MKKQLCILIFLSFICLIVTLIVPADNYLTRTYMINKNYSKNLEKTISKKNIKNYDENFVETLLVAYSLYFMSSDGVVKKPNKKNIAARACMSGDKLNKILEKYNGHLFKISYYTKGQRTYTDSIVLSQELFSLIHVKKNQYRIHQSYVTEMIKTKLPKSPLATLVFYITVMHSNKDGISTISIKKLTGILSQKYERRRTIEDDFKLCTLKRKRLDLHEKRADQKMPLQEYKKEMKNLDNQEKKIYQKIENFRVIQSFEFNTSLEENIRHAMRELVKNQVLNKDKRIFSLNIKKLENTEENHQNINIENIEPGATNNLSFRKEKRTKKGLFSKSQIANKSNFQKFLTPCCKKKTLLGKISKFFNEKKYCKVSKYFLKNKWLNNQTYFCKNLKERMEDFMRENVKLRSQFHSLSKYISFFSFNKKFDLAISLFENLRYFISGKNLFGVNWDNFDFFKKIKEIFPNPCFGTLCKK